MGSWFTSILFRPIIKVDTCMLQQPVFNFEGMLVELCKNVFFDISDDILF